MHDFVGPNGTFKSHLYAREKKKMFNLEVLNELVSKKPNNIFKIQTINCLLHQVTLKLII